MVQAVKERLKEVFECKQFLDCFRTILAACQHAAHSVVYVTEINWLVLEVFPNYGKNATREFYYSLTGLDPRLRAKCPELGA